MCGSIWHNIVLMNTLNSNPGQLLASRPVSPTLKGGGGKQSTFPSLSMPLSKHTFPSVGWAGAGFYGIWRMGGEMKESGSHVAQGSTEGCICWLVHESGGAPPATPPPILGGGGSKQGDVCEWGHVGANLRRPRRRGELCPRLLSARGGLELKLPLPLPPGKGGSAQGSF